MTLSRTIFATIIIASASVYANDNASWRKDQICGRSLPAFTPVDISGCEQALCTSASSFQTKICACLKDEESGVATISIQSAGRLEPKQITVSFMPFAFEANSFRLQTGDYAGNGTEQLLLAAMTSSGNGMGLQGWSLWAINGATISEPLEVDDFGVMSYTTRAPEGGRCRVLGSEWRGGWEPQRGDGLYVVGRWYDLFEGRFSPANRRPVIFHRYLFSLERKRIEAMSAPIAKPVAWHQSKDAKKVVGPNPLR